MDSSLFRSVRSEGAPLRIGLLLDSTLLPRCFAEVVDHIIQSDFAKLELLVFNKETQQEVAPPQQPHSKARKLIDSLVDSKRRQRFLFSLYERWDQRHIDPSKDPLAWVDCSSRFEQIESVQVTPISKRFVHRFPADSIEFIRHKQLDVLLRFGFNILRGDILTAAKYGIWSYHHGDNDFYRGGPAYFWEVYEANPISGAILQVLTEELDAGHVLCKGFFATYPGLSQARNRMQPYWGASTFIIQKLRELREYGWERVEQQIVKRSPYLGKRKIYSAPTNWEMLRWLGPSFCRKTLRFLARRPLEKHWMMAVRSGTAQIPDSATATGMSDFRWLHSPKGRFYADPFLIENGGKVWVFFEDYDYATRRGRISAAELHESGLGEPVSVLEKPYHLSYPCVFRDGETMYMIPESGSNNTVDLYRCTQFPDRWELDRVLLKARAVDTTVWAEDGLYWFFVTMQEPRGGAMQLWLYYAEGLHGDWTPHPANPISTDVRNSRGGGAVFRHNGKLFRPSQDCGPHYGASFTLNEIVLMTKVDYREQPHVTVNPAWPGDWVGTHTYARAGNIEIIDGCARLPAHQVL